MDEGGSSSEDEDGSRKRARVANREEDEDEDEDESGKYYDIHFIYNTYTNIMDTVDEDFVAEDSDSDIPEEFDEEYEGADSSDNDGAVNAASDED
jgi:hypothetical protein